MNLPRRFAFAFSGILVVMLLGLGTGWFLLQKLSSLQGGIYAAKGAETLLEERVAEAKDAKAYLDKNAPGKTAIENVFLREKDLVRFIEDLETAARESKVVLKVASLDLPSSAGGAAPAFGLEASGDFKSLFQYLLLLENLPYAISLDQVRFKKATPWDLGVTLKLLSYEAQY